MTEDELREKCEALSKCGDAQAKATLKALADATRAANGLSPEPPPGVFSQHGTAAGKKSEGTGV